VEIGPDVDAFFDDGDEHIDGDGDPDLSFYGVFSSPKKSFDSYNAA